MKVKHFLWKHWWHKACVVCSALLIIAAILTTALSTSKNAVIGLWAASNALIYIFLIASFTISHIFAFEPPTRASYFHKYLELFIVQCLAHALFVVAIVLSAVNNHSSADIPFDAIASVWGLSVLFLLFSAYLQIRIHAIPLPIRHHASIKLGHELH